jgi:NAD-dependent deacetylase
MKIPEPLRERLTGARHVMALTGAGISAESGLATYRDPQTGLWARFLPQELATPEAFHRRPRLIWEWYASRRQLVERAEPNGGHRALAAMEQRVPRFTLVTQNIDGLHQRAGSRRVIELHGNITRTRCSGAGHFVDSWPATDEVPPRCPQCGEPLRPDVVWFGEMLPPAAWEAAAAAAQDCDVCLVIGTSAVVQPAALLPELAQRAGAMLVEINPEPTPLTARADVALTGPAGTMLPELVRALWP